MNDLVDFLRARLGEDDEVAQATRKNEQFVEGTDRWFASHGNACTSMAPHRAVAEVEAKRRIVDHHSQGDDGTCRELTPGMIAQGLQCTTLCLLALPYAKHPDYRQEWTT